MTRSTSTFVTLLAFSFPTAATYGSTFVPPGLHPGDAYYLAFVTRDTLTAASADIATYNQFAQTEAAQSAALTGTNDGVQWRAIASTPTVSANSSLGLLSGVPIYELRSFTPLIVVSDASALLSTVRPIDNISFDQFGNFDGKIGAWTGTQPGGTSAGVNALGGSSGMSIYGLEEPEPFDPAFAWLDWSSVLQTMGPQSSLGLYAVSTLLTAPVPEPATAWLLLMGGLGLLSWRVARRAVIFATKNPSTH